MGYIVGGGANRINYNITNQVIQDFPQIFLLSRHINSDYLPSICQDSTLVEIFITFK